MSQNKRYFDPAQAESEHKDLIISQLKSELYELRANQKDYNELNSLLNNLQHKYTLLQEEKLRSERDRRQKMDHDQKNVINYKEEYDILQSDLRNQNIDIQELSGDNRALREMSDFRQEELTKLQNEYKRFELDNANFQEDISASRANLKQLQGDKKKLLQDAEDKALEADTLIHKNRNLDKTLATLKIDNQKLDQNLIKLEQLNDRLTHVLKEKEHNLQENDIELKDNDRRVKNLTEELQQADQMAEKAMLNASQNQQDFQNEVLNGKEKAKILNNIETTIRSKELHIDDLRNNYEELKSKHYALADDNKAQSQQIESILSQIDDLNYKNKELVQQIDNFGDQDEKVRVILDRRNQSNDLVRELEQGIRSSAQPIQHLTNI